MNLKHSLSTYCAWHSADTLAVLFKVVCALILWVSTTIIPVYKWENWGLKRLSEVLKSYLISGGSKIETNLRSYIRGQTLSKMLIAMNKTHTSGPPWRSKSGAPGIFRKLTAPPLPKEFWEFVTLLGEDQLDCWNAKVCFLRLSLSFGDICITLLKAS